MAMPFKTVAIIGAGTMGSGIATNIAQHGIAVSMIDVSEDAVARAIEGIGGFYDRNAEKGKISEGRLNVFDIVSAFQKNTLI